MFVRARFLVSAAMLAHPAEAFIDEVIYFQSGSFKAGSRRSLSTHLQLPALCVWLI
jgi:hypothetical protein